MQTVIQVVGQVAQSQKQFDGTAYTSGTLGAGGLITPALFSIHRPGLEYVLVEASLDIIGTTAANASVADAELDFVDLSAGILAWNGATTVDPTEMNAGDGDGDITIGDGDGDGDFSATCEGWGDGDGDGEGYLNLTAISLGTLADNDAITGNATFVGVANKDKPDGGVTAPLYSIIEHYRRRLKKSTATQQRITWDVEGLPFGRQRDGTTQSLRLVTTTMVGTGTWTVTYGTRYIKG